MVSSIKLICLSIHTEISQYTAQCNKVDHEGHSQGYMYFSQVAIYTEFQIVTVDCLLTEIVLNFQTHHEIP